MHVFYHKYEFEIKILFIYINCYALLKEIQLIQKNSKLIKQKFFYKNIRGIIYMGINALNNQQQVVLKNNYYKLNNQKNSIYTQNVFANNATGKADFRTLDLPADGLDDGKISFGSKLKNFGKGLISPITSMFTSVKNFAIGAGMVAGGAILVAATSGAALPILIAAGITMGSVQLGAGIFKASIAKTDKEAESAWQGMGAGTSTIALSVAGSKSALKANGTDTTGMSYLETAVECFKQSPSSVSKSFGALTSGKSLTNLKNSLGISNKKPTENTPSLAEENAITQPEQKTTILEKEQATLEKADSKVNVPVKTEQSAQTETLPQISQQKVKEPVLTTLNPTEYIDNSEYLRIYREIANSDTVMTVKSNALEGKSVSELKDFETAIKAILKRSGLTTDDFKIVKASDSIIIPEIKDFKTTKNFKHLVDLYANNRDAFDYLINSDTLYEGFFKINNDSYVDFDNLMKTLDVNALKTMEKVTNSNPIVGEYTKSSDDFYKNPENITKLHDLIAKHKTPVDINVYRGERTVGMFKDIPLDESISNELKTECLKAADTTKEIPIEAPNYDLTFGGQMGKEMSLYDFISQKERLTLADAMELCKYFDDETVDKIMAQLSKTTIDDNRFKSFTFSKSFAEKWKNGGYYNNHGAKMILGTKIKAGTEAVYADDLSMHNGQFEILVNDNPKTISFSDLKFDRDTNTFYVGADLSMHNQA